MPPYNISTQVLLHLVNKQNQYNIYDENMQQTDKKIFKFKKILGSLIHDIREKEPKITMTQLAYQYEINKSTISRLEQGLLDSRISTLWKIAEARGMKFSELALRLEKELGEDFMFMDE